MAEPARGLERGICQFGIGVACILLGIIILTQPPHWVAYVAPLGILLAALARLKGWVKRGSGGGGGGP